MYEIVRIMKVSFKIPKTNDCIVWVLLLQLKCNRDKKIKPWMMQELGPTLKELGIPTLEEIGYDKPELWQESVFDM